MSMSIYDFKIKYLNEKDFNWSIVKGKPCIICNIATKCGFAEKNFINLNELKKEFPNLEILLFPSNSFKQEIKDNREIEERVKKINDKFILCEKINLWSEKSPLFNFLCEQKRGFIFRGIEWNFTKFLIDKNGNFIDRFGPTANIPQDLIKSLF